jgi:signal transduction histidine kinase
LRIKKNGKHLLSLLDNLLGRSEHNSHFFPLHYEGFCPSVEACEVVSLFSEEARKKGVALSLNAEIPETYTILSDPVRYRQVLTNLLSNAIKFTFEGKIQVTLRLIEALPLPLLNTLVSDTGIGLPPNDQARIFDPFFRAEAVRFEGAGGTGLGLYLAQKMTEALGGSLSLLRSAPGLGSSFLFQIPTAPQEN